MALVLTPAEIATVAKAAGFSGEALVTAIATAIGESGGRADARGDVGLQTDKWGPSIGLWQIRSLNAERGKGTTRDELANDDPWINARHAYEISSQGRSFQPWTVFTSGKYRDHLTAARAAAAHPAATVQGKAGNVAGGPDATKTQLDLPGADLVGAVQGIGSAVRTLATGVTSVGDLASKLLWFALPSTWLRIVTGGFGVAFIFIGITMLGREARS